MVIINAQKPLEVLLLLRPSLHCEKVDDLDKKPRLAVARFAHSFDKLAQTRNEPIVTNAKQRTTRNVAHARGFYDQHSGTTFSEPAIPVEILLRDKPVLGRTPGHHRRDPRPAARLE